ncbi:MAG: hypothetical protein V1763_03260 [Parcubacteria group bacterium]
MKLKTVLLVCCLAVLLFGYVLPIHAAVNLSGPLNSAGQGLYGGTAPGADALPKQIGGYIKVLLGIVGVMLVIIIIYAGFLWMTAGGDPDRAKKGREWIINAVIGMLIILSAYAITNFVVSRLVTASSGSGTTTTKAQEGEQCATTADCDTGLTCVSGGCQ